MTTHGGLQFAAYEELKYAVTVAPGWVSGRARERARAPASRCRPRLHAAGVGGDSVFSLGRLVLQEGPAYFAMGAASKLVAVTATYPFQVVKTRMQQRGLAHAEYAATWPTFLATARCVRAW